MKKIKNKVFWKKIGVLFLGFGILFFGVNGVKAQENSGMNEFDINVATQLIQDMQQSYENLKQQLFQLDLLKQTEENKKKYKEIRNQIVSVIQDIQSTTDKMMSNLKKLKYYQEQILKFEKMQKDLKIQKIQTQKYVEIFATLYYKISNEVGGGINGELDGLDLLIEDKSLPQIIGKENLVKSLLLQLTQYSQKLQYQEKKYDLIVEKLKDLKQQKYKQVKQYQADLQKLREKKNYLVEFLRLYKDGKLVKSVDFSKRFGDIKTVEESIHSLLREINSKKYLVNFDIEKLLKKLNNYSSKAKGYTTEFGWPVYPVTYIKRYFLDKEFENKYGVPFERIQVYAKQGSPVYAMKEGIVYHVVDVNGIGINWVMILHPNGYVSVYLFLNRILVHPGDIVQRGQLIGYSGGEPGTKGAGLISEGENLTFGLYKNGVAVDPLNYLDLSVVANPSMLQGKYQIKYLKDKYSRGVELGDFDFMTGKNEIIRMQQFLDKYANGVYKSLDLWQSAVKGTNIDPAVAICIGFAESTLGNHLATAYNVGNVGNDDSGNRVPFSSAYQGIKAIADVLNNKFLGYYHTINQLSRYGNKGGRIYASSPINWQTNVLKCLSSIKGYYVPEDYPFRIGPNPNLGKLDSNLVNLLGKLK